jgi:hypothetical protein
MKFHNFFLFCLSFLASWIRIRIPNTVPTGYGSTGLIESGCGSEALLKNAYLCRQELTELQMKSEEGTKSGSEELNKLRQQLAKAQADLKLKAALWNRNRNRRSRNFLTCGTGTVIC